MQQVLISLLVSHRLSQLLPRPLRRRVRRHVEVNESTAAVFDDNEHVQHSECAGHSDKEITGDYTPCVVAKER
ncbi:hypothetical protein GCM10011488_01610 [Steroidobacter agaridevorans]|nr:hypothetical protein GCM10011488_01610 [Steroidobacter agaridevorans]